MNVVVVPPGPGTRMLPNVCFCRPDWAGDRERREQIGGRDSEIGVVFLNRRGSDPYVAVVVDRGDHELLEHRVLKQVEPRQIGGGVRELETGACERVRFRG